MEASFSKRPWQSPCSIRTKCSNGSLRRATCIRSCARLSRYPGFAKTVRRAGQSASVFTPLTSKRPHFATRWLGTTRRYAPLSENGVFIRLPAGWAYTSSPERRGRGMAALRARSMRARSSSNTSRAGNSAHEGQCCWRLLIVLGTQGTRTNSTAHPWKTTWRGSLRTSQALADISARTVHTRKATGKRSWTLPRPSIVSAPSTLADWPTPSQLPPQPPDRRAAPLQWRRSVCRGRCRAGRATPRPPSRADASPPSGCRRPRSRGTRCS